MTFFERFVRVYRTIKRFIVITSVEFLLRIPTTPAESGALSHVYLREATCFILAIIYEQTDLYTRGRKLQHNYTRLPCREAIPLVNFCNCFNLSQLVSRSTRVTKTNELSIDVIITSNPRQVIETGDDHDLPYVVIIQYNTIQYNTILYSRDKNLSHKISLLA